MRLRTWGVRGSQASPGPDTARYGGNTSCFDVVTDERRVLVLDAGTGIRNLGQTVGPDVERIDILLSHLHMDHIQGLGFFAPLHRPGLDVHLWGPSSTTMPLRQRLGRYLSPPLFPIRLRELACSLSIHDLPFEPFQLGDVTVTADLVCHPGPTCGYRIEHDGAVLAYLSDHEPALGSHQFPREPDWMSGYALAAGADLLLHDSQYSHAEYVDRIGWGHSTHAAALAFAVAAEVRHLMLIHHDPGHDDDTLDAAIRAVAAEAPPGMVVSGGREGDDTVISAA